MTYEEFLSGLEKAIFVQRREEETIKRVQVLKNNGVQLDGFSCVMEGRCDKGGFVYAGSDGSEDPEGQHAASDW